MFNSYSDLLRLIFRKNKKPSKLNNDFKANSGRVFKVIARATFYIFRLKCAQISSLNDFDAFDR